MITLEGEYGKANIYTNTVDNETINQVIKTLNHPVSLNADIKIMPDCHAGKGCVIGYTAKLNEYIVPNLIGVDIGCGVLTVLTNIAKQDLNNIFFENLHVFIRQRIPIGTKVHNSKKEIENILKNFGLYDNDFISQLKEICNITKQDFNYVFTSLGTLGGGNHFIELGFLKKNDHKICITVHSGSRNFGLKVAKFSQDLAIKKNKKLAKDFLIKELAKISPQEREKRINEIKKKTPFVQDLAYLTGKDGNV